MRRRHFNTLLLGALFAGTLGGCVGVYTGPGPRYRPPPHAPAHGYRYRFDDGLIIVFDSGLGVYIVDRHPGWYWYDGHFYRRHRERDRDRWVYRWDYGPRYTGPWRSITRDRLPPGLRRRDRDESGRDRDRRYRDERDRRR